MCNLICLGLGVFVAFRFLRFLYHSFGPKELPDLTGLGKWAVVTGATDGIGRAFVDYCAQKGLNVVLLSRTQSKLETVAKEVETEFGVSTRVIQADFTLIDDNMYARIGRELENLDIGLLINNVGLSYKYPDYFLDLKTHQGNLYSDIINCNITSTVNMTRLVLPGMVLKGRGWIINMSSGLADIPSPLLTLYGASKSFISKFSQDMRIEYESKGIRIQWLSPGLVATSMSNVKKTSLMVPSPKTYVASAMNELSVKTCSQGYITHVIAGQASIYFNYLFPECMGKKILSMMLSTKSRALKKLNPGANASDKQD